MAAMTRLCAFMIAWATAAMVQYGFYISELNPLQEMLTCAPKARPGCLPLSLTTFGTVTAMFTAGGTVSSLACGVVTRALGTGRRASLLAAAVLSAAGALLLALSSSAFGLGSARLLQGLAAGIGVAVVPVYVKELAPPAVSGSVGVLNQVAVVAGIFAAQAIGTYAVTTGASWRRVPQASLLLAVVQLVTGALWAVESPGWVEGEGAAVSGAGAPQRAAALRERLWGDAAYERAPSEADDAAPPRQPTQMLSPLRDPAFRRALHVVALSQLAQQLSGVNAIMYYSTGILSGLMPAMAPALGLLITVVNGAMTFPPIWLIPEHRVGRKRLLVGSAGSMALFCAVLAYALLGAHAWLAGAAILLVIAAFSVGLGPLPWVILPEVLPPESASLGASIGLGINWVANIAVAAGFQPLRRFLGAWDHNTGGLVFAVFAVANAAFALALARVYQYEPPRRGGLPL